MNRSYSKIRHIQESNRILESRLIKSVLSEKRIPNAGGMADIVDLQTWILEYEIDEGIAVFIDNPSGCKKPYYTLYDPGFPNQCMITGSTLCSPGKPCYQKQAVDGIYGKLTQAAFDKDVDGQTLADNFNDPNYDTAKKIPMWSNSRTLDYQIPVTMDTIKGFQYWVWKSVEKDNESSCDSNGKNCSYKSILCGDNFCKKDKAVDGSWGTNTKKAWKKYKEQYYDEGHDVTSTYDKMYKYLNE